MAVFGNLHDDEEGRDQKWTERRHELLSGSPNYFNTRFRAFLAIFVPVQSNSPQHSKILRMMLPLVSGRDSLHFVEEIYRKTFNSFGVTDDQFAAWSNGVAWLAWSRGQSMHGIGNDCGDAWKNTKEVFTVVLLCTADPRINCCSFCFGVFLWGQSKRLDFV